VEPDDEWREDLGAGPEGRILAVDWGERRMGFAVSDPTGTLATGIPTEEVDGDEARLRAVERQVAHFHAVEIVVGLPISMDGTEGPQAERVRAFMDALVERVDVPVTAWDERLTSVQAEAALREQGRCPSRERGQVDRVAATLLLQNYLDSLEA